MQTTPSSDDEWNPVPEDIRDIELMVLAWRDCLLWAVGFKPILDQFALTPGGPLRVARGGITAMVDEATGFKKSEMRRLIEWFNENIWGVCSDPRDDPFNSPEVG